MSNDFARLATVVPAQNLRGLLALDYEEFVECAYLTILNRSADSDGLAHFVERLRVGHPKLAILGALYGSEEARSANVRIGWLQGAILRHKLTRLPLIKLFFDRANHSAILLEFEHRIHVLEKQVATLSSETAATLKNPDELARSVTTGSGASEEEEQALSGKSPVTKRMYNELVEAISEERADPSRS
jgi:hypothetical protein